MSKVAQCVDKLAQPDLVAGGIQIPPVRNTVVPIGPAWAVRSPNLDSAGRNAVAQVQGGWVMLSQSDAWAVQIKFMFAGFLALTLVGCFLTQP